MTPYMHPERAISYSTSAQRVVLVVVGPDQHMADDFRSLVWDAMYSVL
jgi:hypothetical protein